MDQINFYKDLLKHYVESINLLKDSLDDSFLKFADNLVDCKWKIAITGIWKSWYIWRKMASTFNTIWKSAIYVNPIELLHWEMGLIDPNDLFLIISRSWETTEIIELIDHIKNNSNKIRDIKILGIIWDSSSYLWNICDFKIKMSFTKEIDYNNILPTTSALVTLAIWDLLSVYILNKTAKSNNDLFFYHKHWDSGEKLKNLI